MATVAAPRRVATADARPRPAWRLTAQALRDSRVRAIGFFYLFAVIAYVQPVAYRHTYRTLAERISFAHGFGHDKAVVLFYGKAYDLLSVGGYSAWRVGGTLAIFAAVFGVLAAVRALRADEDAGRAELVLAGAVARETVFGSALAAIAAQTVLLWLGVCAGLVAGGLPLAGSAYLALAVACVVPVFVGAGALISQVAPTRRMALELGSAAVAVAFVLRVIADTAGGAGWLRWATPLGWAEMLRPFTGARPLVLLLPVAATGLLLGAASRIQRGRDIGRGLLAAHESARPRLALLGSTTAQALRSEVPGITVWVVSVGALGLVIGVIAKSISSATIPKSLSRALEKLGTGPAFTPTAYIAFCFSIVVVAVSVLCVSHVAAARQEEAEGRLETVLAEAVARRRWLVGRMLVAVAAATATAVAAAVMAWAGATAGGLSLSLPRMLEAGLNCLPTAILFLGAAALAFAALPRAGSALAYGLVLVMYVWQLFGSLLGAPRWLVDATPFAHVALVPLQSLRVPAALAMLAIGAGLAAIAVAVFERRDIIGP